MPSNSHYTALMNFSLRGWKNVLFELGSDRVISPRGRTYMAANQTHSSSCEESRKQSMRTTLSMSAWPSRRAWPWLVDATQLSAKHAFLQQPVSAPRNIEIRESI